MTFTELRTECFQIGDLLPVFNLLLKADRSTSKREKEKRQKLRV